MYKIPEEYPMPKEVNDYLSDSESLGMAQDLDNWYVTNEWCEIFKKHHDILLKLAENGEPWSQYHLGNMYFHGCLHNNKEDYIENYKKDASIGSEWLVKAAKKGFIAAVDNLVVMGIGEESERLRKIFKQIGQEHPEYIQKWEKDENISVILPSLFEAVYERAYGKDS